MAPTSIQCQAKSLGLSFISTSLSPSPFTFFMSYSFATSKSPFCFNVFPYPLFVQANIISYSFFKTQIITLLYKTSCHVSPLSYGHNKPLIWFLRLCIIWSLPASPAPWTSLPTSHLTSRLWNSFQFSDQSRCLVPQGFYQCHCHCLHDLTPAVFFFQLERILHFLGASLSTSSLPGIFTCLFPTWFMCLPSQFLYFFHFLLQ